MAGDQKVPKSIYLTGFALAERVEELKQLVRALWAAVVQITIQGMPSIFRLDVRMERLVATLLPIDG